MTRRFLLPICCVLLLSLVLYFAGSFDGQAQAQRMRSLADNNLDFEVIVRDIRLPTGLAFLGPDDMLILEQFNGTVLRIKDNKTFPTPLLDVNVAQPPHTLEGGLLGIEIMHQESAPPFVFLYYTEAKSRDGGTVLGDKLYRYTFVDDINGGKLINKTLLLDLPSIPVLINPPSGNLTLGPSPIHHGGKLTLGPDRNIYVTVGDLRLKTKAQNFMNGPDPVGSGGILRITPTGQAVGNGILGSSNPVDKYFAYGIRNSFGIDFDPIAGYLWETENGPIRNDEINLVRPGFNSGWHSLTGFKANNTQAVSDQEKLLASTSLNLINAIRKVISNNLTAVDRNLQLAKAQLDSFLPPLYNFDGKGTYSDPQLVWQAPVAPTAVQFYNSSILGTEYQNHMFVGEFNTGKILNFALNDSRNGLDLDGILSDSIVNTANETDTLLFGRGFGGISDIEVGPDGFLYVVERNTGTVTRIFPKLAEGINATG